MCLKGKAQLYVNIGVGAWDLFLPSFLQEIFTKYLSGVTKMNKINSIYWRSQMRT